MKAIANGVRICLSKHIVSFGDSFIYGSELENNDDGSKAWPGVIAKRLECNYTTRAVPGCSNDHIARQIYSYFSNNSKDVLAVINWTWIERFEFYVGEGHERWTTLGQSCVPTTLSWLDNETKAQQILDFYKDFGRSTVWNKFKNLQTIASIHWYLKQHNIMSIQTYMDHLLFDMTHLNLSPDYIRELQNMIKPELQLFDQDLNFLDWARKHRFEITDPRWHPIGESHNVAADLWQERFKEKLYDKS